MEIISTPGDGSCFFHAILQAYSLEYAQTKDKAKLVRSFRNDLAEALPVYYDRLLDGYLPELGNSVKEYQLTSMQALLRSNKWVGSGYAELVSRMIEKDIYVMDARNLHGKTYSDEKSVTGRDTYIVIRYNGTNHYETVGVRKQGRLITHFSGKFKWERYFPAAQSQT